jgi:hypothetical protein
MEVDRGGPIGSLRAKMTGGEKNVPMNDCRRRDHFNVAMLIKSAIMMGVSDFVLRAALLLFCLQIAGDFRKFLAERCQRFLVDDHNRTGS